MKNKEIEELLNSIDEIIKEAPDEAIYGIQIKEYKQIKNYIEQLEKDNQCKYRNCCNDIYECSYAEYQEMCNKNMEMALKLEQLEKRNKQLYEGFMATQEELTDYAIKNEQLENNRDKAIEYIENDLQISILPNNQIINGTEVVKRINIIIDILKGDSDE